VSSILQCNKSIVVVVVVVVFQGLGLLGLFRFRIYFL